MSCGDLRPVGRTSKAALIVKCDWAGGQIAEAVLSILGIELTQLYWDEVYGEVD